MAVRKAARDVRSETATSAKTAGDGVEQKVMALAEQLGGFLGTVQAKAEGWLDRDALVKEVGRIRDGASELLDVVKRASEKARAAAAAPPVAPPARPSRGPVDAPGKRHRKPPPQELFDKRMGEPVGRKMGQKGPKNPKNRMRSGRG
jgi:hypothetical protein